VVQQPHGGVEQSQAGLQPQYASELCSVPDSAAPHASVDDSVHVDLEVVPRSAVFETLSSAADVYPSDVESVSAGPSEGNASAHDRVLDASESQSSLQGWTQTNDPRSRWGESPLSGDVPDVFDNNVLSTRDDGMNEVSALRAYSTIDHVAGEDDEDSLGEDSRSQDMDAEYELDAADSTEISLVIGAWLDSMQLPQYREHFLAVISDLMTLVSLQEADLVRMGITDEEHRSRILSSITEASQYAETQRDEDREIYEAVDREVLVAVDRIQATLFKQPRNLGPLFNAIGLDSVTENFVRAGLDLYALMEMPDTDFELFGIVEPLHLRKLLVALDFLSYVLKEGASSAADSQPANGSPKQPSSKSCSIM
jgi:hypothetical protein